MILHSRLPYFISPVLNASCFHFPELRFSLNTLIPGLSEPSSLSTAIHHRLSYTAQGVILVSPSSSTSQYIVKLTIGNNLITRSPVNLICCAKTSAIDEIVVNSQPIAGVTTPLVYAMRLAIAKYGITGQIPVWQKPQGYCLHTSHSLSSRPSAWFYFCPLIGLLTPALISII